MADDNHSDEQDISYEESPDLEAGDDLAGDAAVGERTIKKLRERLAAAEEEKAKNMNGWQRAQADLANATRRHDEERKRFVAMGEESVIEAILPTLDAFDMAMGNKAAWEKADPTWRQGVELIRAQLLATLARFGVAEIPALGETFDPARHQPIATQKAENVEDDNQVVAVSQKGYQRGVVVIRPAMVTVAHAE